MHSFMGLAALALMREKDGECDGEGDGLEELDPALCITKRAKERLVGMEWWKGTRK